MKALVQGCPSLEVVDFTGSARLDDFLMDVFISRAPDLRTLILNENVALTNDVLDIIAQECHNLVHFEIGGKD